VQGFAENKKFLLYIGQLASSPPVDIVHLMIVKGFETSTVTDRVHWGTGLGWTLSTLDVPVPLARCRGSILD